MIERATVGLTGGLAVLGVVLLGLGVTGLGGVLLIVAVVSLVALAVGPTVRSTSAPTDVVVPRPVGPDRTGLAVTQRRLVGALADPASFDATVRPQLVALARARLRRRHGIDVATDPEQARALLGDPLWSLVEGSDPLRPRRARELADLVTRIEAL